MAYLTEQQIQEMYPEHPHLWQCVELEDWELRIVSEVLDRRKGKKYLPPAALRAGRIYLDKLINRHRGEQLEFPFVVEYGV